MSEHQPPLLEVVSSTRITPNMQRTILTGEALKNFPTDCASGYVKLLFTPSGSTDLNTLSSEEQPIRRTYSIRHFDIEKRQIEIDFVCHESNDPKSGFGARWGMNAQAGDTISIAGPGLIKELNLDADWFFCAADMTSLPALSAKLRGLPVDAIGHAIIQVTTEQDRQTLVAPAGIEVQWLVADSSAKTLVDKVREAQWMAGKVAVWCACEFDSMRQLRQYFRNEKEVDKDDIYISSYWKLGVTEEGHKIFKREDANRMNA